MPRCIVLRSVAATLSVMAILAIANLFTGQANAQVTGATLSGTITDPSGAAIANAQVSIANKGTGVSRAAMTDAAGLYSAPNLLPGTYDVTVAAPGFSATKESNITLTVGSQQVLNVALKIGEASQTVVVTEGAAQVQLSSSTLSSEVESRTITELPLNGRDWASLATLTPGVNAIENQLSFESGAVRGNRGFGAQLTIAGGRPTQNNYRLDGLSINDYGNGGPGSVLGVSLGVDAIAEFSVLTGNYSAEYGRTSGGVVNAISKSGSNGFHGDVYEFLRNDKLDAREFFAGSRPPFKRNQFGGAVGGPIRKDKTFFFFDYEGIRQNKGFAITSNTPSPNARLGILSGKPAANQPTGTQCTNSWGATGHYLSPLAAVCVNDAIGKFLALYPAGNGTITGDKQAFNFSGVRVAKENFYTSRVDHRISDKDSLFGTYMYDNTPYTQPNRWDDILLTSQTQRYVAALEESHTFSPTLFNTARAGFNRNYVLNNQTLSPINPAAADPSLALFPNSGNPNTRTVYTPLDAGSIGAGVTIFNWNSIQFYDDAFLTHGNHSLKFGFALERMRFNSLQRYNPEGILRFTGGVTSFLTDQPNSLEGGLPVRTNPRGTRQTLLGGYVQDDWKVRPGLTLNVGLRYEMTTVLNEVQGKLTNLRNITDPLPYCGTTNPDLTLIFGKPGCTGAAPYYSNPTTKNFEPRFGFAYDPKGNGKTAIRGGLAIFDVLPLPGYFFTQQSIQTPFFLNGIVAGTPANPLRGIGVTADQPNSAFSRLGASSLTGAWLEPNPKRNYIEQWNINVQRQITTSLTATVGYIGSHGVHMMIRGDDADMVIPTEISPGQWMWPYNPTGKDMRINPNFGGIRFMTFGTTASYNALQFNVQQRLSHGLQFGGSYTYSKAMDDDSATIAGDAFSNSLASWFWFAPRISHAVSDFNITHSAAINGIWQVPSPRAGIARAVLGGWQLGSIVKLNSGIPTTPIIGGDPLGVQNAGSDEFGLPDRVPGCDAVNHNYKSDPGGIPLGYINYSCFTLPKAPADPKLAAQCVPFVGNGTLANPQFPGTCSNLLGNAGRNSIVGPSLANVDFSVIRNFAVKKISESFNIQFRAELFNILNHANFVPPVPFQGNNNAQLFDASGASLHAGALDTLATSPRDIQFAVKVIF